MKWKVKILVILCCISCSKDWSCPAEKGFSCMTINQVDSSTKQETQDTKQRKNHEKINPNILSKTIKEIKMDDLAPVRTQEMVGKILITPYIDKDGNLNSGKYVYTIDETPKWMIK